MTWKERDELDQREIKMTVKALLIASAITVAAGTSALPAPPPGTDLDSPIHIWFERQQNVRGQSCCANSDGHMLDDKDVRIKGGTYEVLIEGTWYPVRLDAMRDSVRGGPNPTGHPIVWYTRTFTSTPGLSISCFAPGTLL
jgi:hypothetical protein